MFKIYNNLGYGYKEKEYQKAFETELENLKLNFKRELYCPILYEGKILSKFYADFQIEDKLIVELKVANDFYLKHRQQVIQYLKTNKLELALIAVITPQKVLIKRIINSKDK